LRVVCGDRFLLLGDNDLLLCTSLFQLTNPLLTGRQVDRQEMNFRAP